MANTDTRIRITAQDDASPAFDRVADHAARMNTALRGSVPDMDRLGVSAKQTAAAMRGVPAQMTDIITSLQGGQAPLTVLLQQGGQLKDMFGGVGNAAKALGGYVIGMVNPFTLAAAAAGTLALAYYQGSKEASAYSKAIILTGNAAGATVGQMQAAAASAAKLTGATQGAAAEAIAAMASTGNIAARDFERFGAVAVKVQREAGIAVADTVKQFSELGKDPLQASIKLNETTRHLTLSVYEQVKALTDQGRAAEAAALAQTAYASSMDTRMTQLQGSLGYVEKAWRGITDVAKGAWDAMLGVGRQSSIGEQLAAAQKELEDKQRRGPLNETAGVSASWEKGNEALRQRIAHLNEMVRMEKRGAEASAASAAQVQARIKWGEDESKYISKALALEREITAARKTGAAAGLSQADIEARIAAIRAKGAEVAKRNKPDAWLTDVAQSYAKTMDDLARVQASAAASAEDLSKSQEKLRATMAAPEWQAYSRQQQEQVIYAASLAQASEDQAAATKQAALATKAAAQAHSSYIADLNKSADAVGAHIQKLQDEEAALAISAAEHISLAQAIELVEIARLNEAVAVQLSYGDNTAAEAIQREIDARRELIGLIGNKEARDSSKKAAEDAAKEWQRTSEQINSTLTDALMRGFESGKDFAKNMRDTIVNMFKTMVLRPVISAIVNPVAQGITGMLGLGGLANAATGGGDLSTAAAAASIFGAGGIGGALAGGAGWLTGATTFGGALSAGASLIGTGTAAGAASGAGMIVGALAPIALGIGALVAIAKATKGETRSGGQYTYSAATGTMFAQGPSGGQIAGTEVQAAITGTVTSINKLLQNAGSVATLTGFQAGLESSDKGRGGVFSGGTLSTGATFGESGKGSNYDGTLYEKTSANSLDSKTALENFTTDLMQGTIQALQAAGDIPKAIADQLKGVDAEALSADAAKNLLAAIDATVTGINNFRAAVDVLPFESLKNLSFDAAAGLIAAAGGLDKLGAGLSSYYDNFYTEAEKTANTTANITKVFADLGLPMLDLSASAEDVRASFRALVDGAMADTTEAGQKTTAALLGVSGALGGLIAKSVNAVDSAARSAYTGMQVDARGKTILSPSEQAHYNADAGYAYTIDGLQRMADMINAPAAQAVSGGYGSPEEIASRMANTMGAGNTRAGPSEEETAAKAAADAIAKASASAAKALVDLASIMDGQRKDSFVGGLTQLGSALYGITDAMEDAIKKATALGATEADLTVIRSNAARKTRITLADSAYATLERSVAAAGKSAALEDALGEYARNALEGMTRVAPQLAQQGLADATSKIEAALSLKKAGGTLDLASLKESINTLAGTGTETFGTFQDYARSLSKSQGLLGQLGTSGPSLDQQMLDANQAVLEQAKKQLDALHGIDNSVLLVADAMAAFQSALAGTATPNADALVLGGVSPALDIGRPVGSGSNDIAAMVAEIKALREALARQQAAMESIAINTNKTAKSLTKWDVDGLPATTTAE